MLLFPRRAESGILLLEVMLATAIFAMVALSLAVALNATIDAFLNIRRESQIRVALQSALAETTSQRLIVNREQWDANNMPGTAINPGESRPAGDLEGVTFQREVKELDLQEPDTALKSNAPRLETAITGLYEVNIAANWVEDGQKMQREVQQYVYQAQ